MKTTLFILYVCFTINCDGQSRSQKYSNLFSGGEVGTKIGMNYNFKTNFISADIGLMKFDAFPKAMSCQPNDFSMLVNHNMFVATEINLNKQFLFGPKIGWELNVLFGSVRLNLIDYFDLKGNNNVCFRPEIGPTLIGIYSLYYGYTFNLTKSHPGLNVGHTITFTYNFHLSPKYLLP